MTLPGEERRKKERRNAGTRFGMDRRQPTLEPSPSELAGYYRDALRYQAKREIDWKKALQNHTYLAQNELAWKLSYDLAIDAAISAQGEKK